MGTDATGGPARAPGRAVTAIRNLDPGSFAFVMATAIISTGTFRLGPAWLSRALLAAALIGLLVLSAALVIRLAIFGAWVVADVQAPDRVFGFFAIVARIDVLGLRLGAAGHPLIAANLAGLAACVWLVLTYGIPASLLLTREPAALPVSKDAAGLVRGSSFALWAFGTWWIPLLIRFGLWRHVRHHWPVSYEPALWSLVFPLGMYSVTTLSFGQAARLGFTETPEPTHALGGRRRLDGGSSRVRCPASPLAGRSRSGQLEVVDRVVIGPDGRQAVAAGCARRQWSRSASSGTSGSASLLTFTGLPARTSPWIASLTSQTLTFIPACTRPPASQKAMNSRWATSPRKTTSS